MALDVWLNRRGELPYLETADTMEHVAALHWDGYFAYLARYWAVIEAECGSIDPYDSNEFYGDDLLKLEGCLLTARSDARTQAEEWTEHTGAHATEPPTPIYETVVRRTLVELIDRLLDAARRARAHDKQLLFFGD